jgi:hypothetical protein
MSRKVPLSDFRAVRIVLEPDDFALGGDEPDPPPSDQVSRETWSSITGLPDNVAIRTSDHNGKALAEAYRLWGQWHEALPEPQDAIFTPMLDAADDLQSSIFSALHGYYRTGFSALRNVLEVTTIGACGCLQNNHRYAAWRTGAAEFKFGTACDQLYNEPALGQFNARMRGAGYQSLWDQKQGALPGGYSRRLYRDLCNYAHSRPGFTDGDLWQSNGPIYVGRVFQDWYYAYLQTVSLCCISVLLAWPKGDRSALTGLLTDDPQVLPGCLTDLGVATRDHVVGVRRV